ncbi:MAG: DegV family protein [Gemmatimonadales bacterium]
MATGIVYVDGPRLARSMYAAADWVAAGRDEINRINVFPVPDGDTGTNFSLTLRSVADALQALGNAPLGETAQAAARGAVLGARGNSGMMLAHFLLGFAESIGARRTATAPEIAAALERGADTLYHALDEPREGTILTVAREVAKAAKASAASTKDLRAFLRETLERGNTALAETTELLAVLKEAGVVDAGGMGFVRMFEGVVRLVEGDPILAAQPVETTGEVSAAAEFTVAAERDFQYCTECLVRGDQLPAGNDVRAAMHAFGGSVVVVSVGDILKIHVHTDTPDAVFAYAERWGQITARKADDMRAQHRALQHHPRRPVAVIADSSADLPDTVLDRHHISLVPLQVTFGDTTYLDRIGLKPEEFYRLLRDARTLPTTSQPAPGEFVRAFRSGEAAADEVVAVLLSGGLSGTVQAAQAARRAGQLDRVHLFDSRTVSLGLGMLALRAAELAESGWTASAIVSELDRVRSQSGLFLTVDTYENLLRSGRVSRGKAWLAGMLDVKPILSLDAAGKIIPVDRVRGRDHVVARVLNLVDRALTPRPTSVRFGVAHANAPEVAERVRTALVAAYRPRDCFVALATGVLGTHVGIGAWAVFFQVEDGTPIGPPTGGRA